MAAYKVKAAAYTVDQYCPPLGQRKTIKKTVRFKIEKSRTNCCRQGENE